MDSMDDESSSSPPLDHDSTTVEVSRFRLLSRTFFLMSKWASESFLLRITDGRFVWEGRASSSYIKDTLLPPGMELKHYLSTIRDALAHQDETNEKYSYELVQLSNPDCAEVCRHDTEPTSERAYSRGCIRY